jgi:hypothetical protein
MSLLNFLLLIFALFQLGVMANVTTVHLAVAKYNQWSFLHDCGKDYDSIEWDYATENDPVDDRLQELLAIYDSDQVV